MKKTLIISFLLLANLLFLAHAAIPHHHHGSVTCFAVSHCCEGEDHEHSNDDGHCGTEHNHDHSNGSLCKILQDIVPSETNNHKFKVEVNDFQSLILVLIPDFSNLENEEVDINFLLRDTSWQSFYESIIVSGQGLRAPPIC